MSNSSGMPSRWQYVVGGGAVAAGLALFAILLYVRSERYVPDIRAAVPGTHRIVLEKPGEYSVYYEYESVIDGRVYSTERTLSGLFIRLRRVGDPEPLELSRPSGRGTYDARGRAGGEILRFEIDEPGSYELTAVYQEPGGTEVVLAVGRSSLLRAAVPLLVLPTAGFLVGGLLIGRAYMKRRSLGRESI